MQVWPRAACCDVRETERVRGRKGGGEMVFGSEYVFAHGHLYVCKNIHTSAHIDVDIIQFRQGRVCTGERFLLRLIGSNRLQTERRKYFF